jgi:hypothetical protein
MKRSLLTSHYNEREIYRNPNVLHHVQIDVANFFFSIQLSFFFIEFHLSPK